MVPAPTTIWGFPAVARGEPLPTTEGSGRFSLMGGGMVNVTFLRWNLADFRIDDADLSGIKGWLRTIVVDAAGVRLHLTQGHSIFWSTRPELRLESILASEVRAPPAPQWSRRSDRFWPSCADIALPFLGQGMVLRHDVYLFGALTEGLLAAHVMDLSEQDAEDHYDEESDV